MPTYVIGDVQGCYRELCQLLEQIGFSSTTDKLWFVGDLVNRGPHSLEVLRFVKGLDHRAIVVLGNHDLHLLALHAQVTEKKSSDQSVEDILNAPDCDELMEWLRFCPLLHYAPELNVVMTHAGWFPQWTLSVALGCANEVEKVLSSANYIDFLAKMYGNAPPYWSSSLTGLERLRFITNCLTRMRFCDANGVLDFNEKGDFGAHQQGLYAWFEIPSQRPQGLKVLFGHWSTLQLQFQQMLEYQVYPLDTGCCWGRSLTCLCLETMAFHSVRALS